jgi:hypothetical protein
MKKNWKFEMQNNGLNPWKSDIIQSFASPYLLLKLQCQKSRVPEAHLFPCIAQKCYRPTLGQWFKKQNKFTILLFKRSLKQQGQGNLLENLQKNSHIWKKKSNEIAKIFGGFGLTSSFLLLKWSYLVTKFYWFVNM